jgi:hypothetical protein
VIDKTRYFNGESGVKYHKPKPIPMDNISVILWQSVLLVEETRVPVPGENH